MKQEFPPDIDMDDDDFFEKDDNLGKSKKLKGSRTVNPLESTNQKIRKTENVIASDSDSSKIPLNKSVKPVRNITPKPQLSQMSPISATSFLSTRFGIPADVLQQLSPAQMQSLILRYPQAGFVPALQGLMGNKVNFSSRAVSSAVMTTTLCPLQQLANTALAPSSSTFSGKSAATGFSILHKGVPTALNVTKPSVGPAVGQTQSNLGRPKKTGAPIISTTTPLQTGGYVSGLSVSGIPVAIQWNELKKQLMAQMISTSSTSNSLSPRKYVSGVTISGAPITMEWEELKKQLASQINKEDNSPSSKKDNINMPLVQMSHMMEGSSKAVAVVSSHPPTLHTVSKSAAISFNSSKDFSTTTPANLKMFSFSNVLKNKDAVPSPSKPVTIKTPAFNLVASTLPNANSFNTSVSALSNVRLQSGHSKVQDWLHSSSPFIAQDTGSSHPITKISHCVQNQSRSFTSGIATAVNPASIYVIRSQVSSQSPQIISSTRAMEFIPRPNFLSSSSRIVTLPFPTAHHVTTISSNPMNIIPIQKQLGSSSRISTAANKSNLLDLQKAALQAAAVNQISSKLHNHLRATSSAKKETVSSTTIGQRKEVVTLYQPKDLLMSSQVVDSKKESNTASSFFQSENKNDPYTLSEECISSTVESANGANMLHKDSGIKIQPTRIIINPPLIEKTRSTFDNVSLTSVSTLLQVNCPPFISQTIANRLNPLSSIAATGSNLELVNRSVDSLNNNLSHISTVIPVQLGEPIVSTVIPVLHNKDPPKPIILQHSKLSNLIVSLMNVQQPLLSLPVQRSQVPKQTTSSLPLQQSFLSQPVISSIPLQPQSFKQTVSSISMQHPQASQQIASLLSVQPSQLSNQIISSLPVKQVQLPKLIVSSVPALTKISQSHTVQFKAISSDITGLQPKVVSSGKQVIIPRRMYEHRGPTVRYILPAQGQIPTQTVSGGQVFNPNQLVSPRNTYLPSASAVKRDTTKSARIVSGNLPNGMVQLTNGSSIVNSSIIDANMFSSVPSTCDVGSSSHTIGSDSLAKSSLSETLVSADDRWHHAAADTSKLMVTAGNQVVLKNVNPSQTSVIRSSLSRSDLNMDFSYKNNSCSPAAHTQQSVISDTYKLLPKTEFNRTLSIGNQNCSVDSSRDNGEPNEKVKHVVLEPTQLQKLKEEGRIVMTPTGQLVMIPPNLVGKVSSSVFK